MHLPHFIYSLLIASLSFSATSPAAKKSKKEPLPQEEQRKICSALTTFPKAPLPENFQANRHVLPYQKEQTMLWCLFGSEQTKFQLVVGTTLSKDTAQISNEKVLARSANLVIPVYRWQWVEFVKADFAPFKLGPLGRAFGLKFRFSYCGAAANCVEDEDLLLFATEGSELRNILTTATSTKMDSSMGPNEDGTRTYDHTESYAVVAVGKAKGGKIPDLLKRRKKSGQLQTFRWQEKTKIYQTSDPAMFTDGIAMEEMVTPFELRVE